MLRKEENLWGLDVGWGWGGGVVERMHHRRKMEIEAKAKVVASAWGAEFIQCLAALAILPRLIWKNRMTSTFSSKLTKAKGSGLAWCQPEDHSFC